MFRSLCGAHEARHFIPRYTFFLSLSVYRIKLISVKNRSDIFVQAHCLWLSADTAIKHTDTHIDTPGTSLFNYRLCFSVSLPVERESSLLRIQIWEAYPAKMFIGEVTIDMHPIFQMVLHHRW